MQNEKNNTLEKAINDIIDERTDLIAKILIERVTCQNRELKSEIDAFLNHGQLKIKGYINEVVAGGVSPGDYMLTAIHQYTMLLKNNTEYKMDNKELDSIIHIIKQQPWWRRLFRWNKIFKTLGY